MEWNQLAGVWVNLNLGIWAMLLAILVFSAFGTWFGLLVRQTGVSLNEFDWRLI